MQPIDVAALGEDFYGDFVRHFGFSQSEAHEKIGGDAPAYRRELWNREPNRHLDTQAIDRYYLSEQWSVYASTLIPPIQDNAWVEMNFGNEIWFKLIRQLEAERECLSVLDYGCGSATFSHGMAIRGHHVTLVDYANKSFDFLVKRARKYGLDIDGHPIVDCREYPPIADKQFDFIFCLDVPEHVPEPIELLELLMSCMRQGGVLYWKPFFNDMDGQDPSHLKQNKERYHLNEWWEHHIVEGGFEKYPEGEYLWRKIK